MELTKLENIKALAALMEESGLHTLEVQHGEDRLVLGRAAQGAPVPVSDPALTAAPVAGAKAPQEAKPPAAGGENSLTSPLVGNVYLAPAPGKPPFVQVGSAVKKGQVLCIIEAMKVMNELPAPREGTVTEIHVRNDQLVEFGQPLFTLT